MKKIALPLSVLFAALVLASCVVPKKKEKDLDNTLQQYESTIRWSQWDNAYAFLAPEYLEEHPVTRLDLDRLNLFRVTDYAVRSTAPIEGGNRVQQVVQIRMFNKTKATEKVIIDAQDWQYDEESERWLLHSGLPDVLKRY